MGADPSTYSAGFVKDRVKSGKDANRAATVDKLAAQASQPPHEDDAAAMRQLTQLAGDDSTGGFATNDARNYARMQLANIGGPQMGYSEAKDGGGLLSGIGHGLGSLLKIAAPIAGMAIPGLGPLAGAAIAAGGSAAGGMLHGDKFNLGKTLLAGGAGAAGQALNVSKLAGIGGGGGIPAAPSAGALNSAAAASGMPAAAGAAAPGGGILSKIGGAFAGQDGKPDLQKILGTGAAVGGFIDARRQQGAANKFNNARLQQLQRMSGMAEQDYAARGPIREAAYSRLARLGQGPIGSSIYGRAG